MNMVVAPRNGQNYTRRKRVTTDDKNVQEVIIYNNKFIWTKMRLKEGTKIKLQTDTCQIWLKIVCCRFFVGIVQVYCMLFAGYLQSGIHILTSSIFRCCFHSFSAIKKKCAMDGGTDRQTDQRTDGLTLIYRDAWRHLKISNKCPTFYLKLHEKL